MSTGVRRGDEFGSRQEDGDRHHLTVEAAADRRDIATDIAEADVISKALSTLPARSRELLWMAEVEETPPQTSRHGTA